jgi:hypothetical protein
MSKRSPRKARSGRARKTTSSRTGKARPSGRTRGRATAARPTARRSGVDSLLAPIAGADHRVVGGVAIDVLPAGNGRIKRVVYPAGFRWSAHMKPIVGTELCMHAHVGFLARGRVRGRYADGCVFDLAAPRCVVIEPAHDAEVVGPEAAVLIEFDAQAETASRFGLPPEHRHP